MPMQTALLAHSSKSTTTFTDDLLVSWAGTRAYRPYPGRLGLVGPDHPHGEELRTATVGLAESLLGPLHLVGAGEAPHLQGGLQEAQHARGPNGVRRQHATRAV